MSTAATGTPPATRKRLRPLTVVNWAAQIVLAIVGLFAISDESMFFWLLCWCLLASVYATVAITAIAISARRDKALSAPAAAVSPRLRPLRSVLVTLFTVIPTLIGVTAAVQIVLYGSNRDYGVPLKILGMWAMLLAWGFLHWGYAQIYANRAQSEPHRELFDFPRTPHPGLIDFVYFSYIVGTTFAISDVTVLTTKTRWLVTVHSVLAFFMNALLIGFTFNIILSFSTR